MCEYHIPKLIVIKQIFKYFYTSEFEHYYYRLLSKSSKRTPLIDNINSKRHVVSMQFLKNQKISASRLSESINFPKTGRTVSNFASSLNSAAFMFLSAEALRFFQVIDLLFLLLRFVCSNTRNLTTFFVLFAENFCFFQVGFKN